MSHADRKSKRAILSGRNRSPSTAVQRELGARSGGVCYYPGCGQILYRDPSVYWESVNLGELAHNVASSSNGPRGDIKRSGDLSDDPENLLMLCRQHHKTADALAIEYREQTLAHWKSRHEAAVLTAAQLGGGELVLPLIVAAAQIGGHAIQIDETEVVRAILSEGKAPAARPHRILLNTAAQPDDQAAYWASQVHTIRDELRLCQKQQQRYGTEAPIGVFALAEMPALMALGHALGDKTALRIYQYARHANSWAFQVPEQPIPNFSYTLPTEINEIGVALVVSVTALVEETRVRTMMSDPKIPIIHFTTEIRGTEVVGSTEFIAAFRMAFRQCLTDIENIAPRTAPIHLFPCLPVSLAVAVGCCVMPKVSNPIRIYDAKGLGGTFRHCLDLPLPLTTQNLPLITTRDEGTLHDYQ